MSTDDQALVNIRRTSVAVSVESIAHTLLPLASKLQRLSEGDGLANWHREAMHDARSHLAETLSALARCQNSLLDDVKMSRMARGELVTVGSHSEPVDTISGKTRAELLADAGLK